MADVYANCANGTRILLTAPALGPIVPFVQTAQRAGSVTRRVRRKLGKVGTDGGASPPAPDPAQEEHFHARD